MIEELELEGIDTANPVQQSVSPTIASTIIRKNQPMSASYSPLKGDYDRYYSSDFSAKFRRKSLAVAKARNFRRHKKIKFSDKLIELPQLFAHTGG